MYGRNLPKASKGLELVRGEVPFTSGHGTCDIKGPLKQNIAILALNPGKMMIGMPFRLFSSLFFAKSGWLAALAVAFCLAAGAAEAATVVALGASNTYGKGVARAEAYPAQL